MNIILLSVISLFELFEIELVNILYLFLISSIEHTLT